MYFVYWYQIIAPNLGKHRLTRHRTTLPAYPTSSRPRSWSLGNATLVVAERSGRRPVLGAPKPRPSAKGAHPYRKRACLEALKLATTKRTQRGTGYPSWGHPTQLRISRGSTGLILWPQNKWLHKPRTTDYRRTRQDRWIQTDLAFTLAKNAKKPSPFETMPLQTKRKENNWKTEEALARAAVPLETERIKGSSPWCLWWWWW